MISSRESARVAYLADNSNHGSSHGDCSRGRSWQWSGVGGGGAGGGTMPAKSSVSLPVARSQTLELRKKHAGQDDQQRQHYLAAKPLKHRTHRSQYLYTQKLASTMSSEARKSTSG